MAANTAIRYVLDESGKLVDALIQSKTASDPAPTSVEKEIVRIVKEHREQKAEISAIESHLEMLIDKEELSRIGADKILKRDLSQRLMRVFAGYEELSAEKKELTEKYQEYTTGKAKHYHDVWCNVSREEPMGYEGCSCTIGKKVKALQAELDNIKEKGNAWEVIGLLMDMQRACPVGCRTLISMETIARDPVVFRWEYKKKGGIYSINMPVSWIELRKNKRPINFKEVAEKIRQSVEPKAPTDSDRGQRT